MRCRRVIFVVLAGVAGLFGGGCAGGGGAPTQSEQAVIDQGTRLHRALAPAVVAEDEDLGRYIQQVGQRLIEAAAAMQRLKIGPAGSLSADGGEWMLGEQMRFELLDCDLANGFTPGGTHVYLYTGLLQRCQSEEDLAAALAHVYAHLYARHRQQQMALPEDADAEEVILALINNRHTREEELEADGVGFQIFTRAGWDPLAYGSFAQRLGDAQRAEGARLMAERLPPAALDWARPPVADANRFAEYQRAAQQLAGRGVDEDLLLLLTAVPSCLASADTPEQQMAQQQLLNPPVPLAVPMPFEKGPRARPR